MPRLAYTSDGQPYYEPDENDITSGAGVVPSTNPLPVDQSYDPATGVNYPTSPSPYTSGLPVAKNSLVDVLTGAGGGERYQLFPERVVRSALSLPTDVLQGTVTSQINPGRMQSSDVLPEDELLKRVQDMAAMMGGGGLLNTTERAGLQELPSIITRMKNVFKSDNEAAAPVAALENAPIFHSAVENAVNISSLKSASADQWLGTISNAKGVKPEELDWTGLKDYLKEQDEAVSKEQVQQYLQDNKVQLGEVNKGGQLLQHKPEYNGDTEKWDIVDNNGNTIDDGYYDERAARREILRLAGNEQSISAGAELNDGTKYSKYQLPGGENYREKLLTLPKQDNPELIKRNEIIKRRNYIQDEFNRLDRLPETSDLVKQRLVLYNEDEALKTSYRSLNDIEKSDPNYKSSHWDEPNILAHIRINDRTIDGQKALHIEEIQSDWHQQGREKGYKLSPEDQAKLEPEFNRIDDKIVKSGDEEVMGHPDINQAVKMATDRKIITPQEAKTYLRYSDSQRLGAVPDAPFKKTWLDLALKRVIREAAEKGYDRISWTPGEAQAARYDLSKQVDELIAHKNKDGTFGLIANLPGGQAQHPIGSNIPAEKLSDYVGKEMAAKIQKQDFGPEVYDGDKLKVGGEGMHYFYDQMVPKTLEKLTGEKTKQGSVQGPYVGDDKKVNYINLPQQVKDTALHRGFPLFSSGVMLTPTATDPFQHKLTPVDKIPGLTPMSHNPFSVGNDSDPQVNNHDDVPYLAGASDTPSGLPVNIDRRMPRYDPKVLDKTGKPADLWKYLKIHEIEEHKAMLGGTPYAKAHSTIATPAERAAVEADGVNWKEYEHVMDGYLSEIEHEHPKHPPVNLYDKPYPHDKKMLLEKEEANEKDN